MTLPTNLWDKIHQLFVEASSAVCVRVVKSDGTDIGGAGGTSMVDDAAFTPGASSVTPMGAVADQTSPDSVDEGDAGALRMTLDRKLLVALFAKSVADGDVAVTVDADGHLQVDIVAALPTGANAIGKLAANSGVDIGDVDVTSLPATPAGTNLIGKVSTGEDSGTVYIGTTAYTVKRAVIDAATSGNNTLVSAVSNKKLRVLSLFYLAAGTVTVRFESAADGTALTGQMQHTAQTGAVLPFNKDGWFETAASALLNLELSAAISVDGALTYIEAD